MNVLARVQETANSVMRSAVGLNHKGTPVIDSINMEVVEKILFGFETEYNHTPDWDKLEQNKYQLVFLYCECAKGGSKHDVIQDICQTKKGRIITCKAFTQERFEVWQTKDGRLSIPIALTSDAPPAYLGSGYLHTLVKPARVQGQLVRVRSEHLKELDKYKRHGVLFRRRKVPVSFVERFDYVNTIDNVPRHLCLLYKTIAWAYIGKHSYWDKFLDAGYSMSRCEFASEYTSRVMQEPIYHFIAHKIFKGVSNK